MLMDVQRELEHESAVPPGFQKASRVLKRFFHNYVATWRLRLEIKSLRLLTRAFERASSEQASRHHCHPRAPRQSISVPVSAALRAAEKQKRVLELQHRVSIHLECDLSIMKDVEDPEDGSSRGCNSSSSSCCEERVSVESVVHKLFLQVEETKRQAEAKDARILELEALVASLTFENHHLRCLLLDVKPQSTTMMTTLHSSPCNVDGEQIDDRGSNQLVVG